MVYEFARCSVDTGTRELSRDGAPVAIEPRALELLLYLIEHRDRAVGKDELQERVWGTIVTDGALSRCVMKLRRAVGDPDVVRTVRGHGYRFTAPLREAALPSAAPVAAPPAQDARPSIAVLPLLNLSGDPDNEYFSDGIAEEILNLLARMRDLRVASRTSSFSYRGTNADVRTIAAELDVDYVLEGSVRRAADRVRIAHQLIDARADANVWSEIYDRELTDIFALQAEIASEVVAAIDLAPSISRPCVASSRTMPPRASAPAP